jgi:hypothetical protein
MKLQLRRRLCTLMVARDLILSGVSSFIVLTSFLACNVCACVAKQA